MEKGTWLKAIPAERPYEPVLSSGDAAIVGQLMLDAAQHITRLEGENEDTKAAMRAFMVEAARRVAGLTEENERLQGYNDDAIRATQRAEAENERLRDQGIRWALRLGCLDPGEDGELCGTCEVCQALLSNSTEEGTPASGVPSPDDRKQP